MKTWPQSKGVKTIVGVNSRLPGFVQAVVHPVKPSLRSAQYKSYNAIFEGSTNKAPSERACRQCSCGYIIMRWSFKSRK